MSSATAFDVPTNNVGRDVATSALAQVVARGVHVVCAGAVLFAVLRYLGPDRYGDYVLVVTVVGLATILTELDLPNLATRAIAHDASSTESVVGTVTVLRLGLAVGAALVMQVVIIPFGSSAQMHFAAAVAALALIGEALLSVVILHRVRLKHQHEAAVRLIGKLVEVAVVAVVIAAGLWIPWLFLAAPAGVLTAATIAWLSARRSFGIRLSFDAMHAKQLTRAALVAGPSAIIGVLYLKVDAFMVGILLDQRALGTYGAAFQPIEYLFLMSGVLSLVLFPLLARFHGEGSDRFATLYRRGAILLLAPTLVVPVFVLGAGRAVIDAIDPRYKAAGVPLMLLSCALVFLVLNAWQSFTLLAAHHQRVTLRYLAWCTVVNIGLGIPLTLWLGINGTALATLLTAALLFAVSTAACARYCQVRLDARRSILLAAIALAAAGLMIASTTLGVPLAVTIVGGSIGYCGAILVARAVCLDDLRQLAGDDVVVDLTARDAR